MPVISKSYFIYSQKRYFAKSNACKAAKILISHHHRRWMQSHDKNRKCRWCIMGYVVYKHAHLDFLQSYANQFYFNLVIFYYYKTRFIWPSKSKWNELWWKSAVKTINVNIILPTLRVWIPPYSFVQFNTSVKYKTCTEI